MQQQQQWLVSHITEYTSDSLAVSLHMKDHSTFLQSLTIYTKFKI